jgi:small subunit ribosomal protein S8e
MARTQHRSKRKASGGRYRAARGKKGFELVGYATHTKLHSDCKTKTKRTIGGGSKSILLSCNVINVASKGKIQKTEIVNVLENQANPNLVRRNVITKGAVVETKLGKARVTSRPGQEGTINGILL